MQFSSSYNSRPRKILLAVMTTALCFEPIVATPGQNYGSKRSKTTDVTSGDEIIQNAAIRAFRVNIPEKELADLRRRLVETRWPDKETVDDRSQGAQLANLQELVRYWGTS